MKLRLILANVGTLTGARVINAETGEELFVSKVKE